MRPLAFLGSENGRFWVVLGVCFGCAFLGSLVSELGCRNTSTTGRQQLRFDLAVSPERVACANNVCTSYDSRMKCYNTSSAEKLRAKKWVPKWCVFGVGEPAAGYRNPSMPASFLLIRSTVCSTKSVACVKREETSSNGFAVLTNVS